MTDAGAFIASALVVDDQEPHRKLATALLGKLGIQKLWMAADGQEALRLAKQFSPDLLICDIDMPGTDGMAVLRGLRELAEPPEVVILSSLDAAMLSTVHRLAQDYNLPVLGALSKPLHIQALSGLLERSRRRVLVAPPAPQSVPATAIADNVLLDALERDAFEPYMEPKIERISGRVIGVEMLARLKLDTVVAPARFISRLETLGHIDRMTWQLTDKSLGWLSHWMSQGLSLTLSINLSAAMIESPGMVDQLTALLRKHGVSARHITLEITESIAISSRPETLEILARLRLRGFGLSIDDFGTGYSSLSQLSSVPFSELKIDRAFTIAAEEDYKARVVVESSLELARKLGLKSCAEGVGQASTFRLFYDLGVDLMQGYQFTRPMPADDFGGWVRQWNARMTARRLYMGEML